MAPMATLDPLQLIHDLLHMGGHILALVFASGRLFHDLDLESINTGSLSRIENWPERCLGGAPHHMEMGPITLACPKCLMEPMWFQREPEFFSEALVRSWLMPLSLLGINRQLGN